jgi:hypothetical protein
MLRYAVAQGSNQISRGHQCHSRNTRRLCQRLLCTLAKHPVLAAGWCPSAIPIRRLSTDLSCPFPTHPIHITVALGRKTQHPFILSLPRERHLYPQTREQSLTPRTNRYLLVYIPLLQISTDTKGRSRMHLQIDSSEATTIPGTLPRYPRYLQSPGLTRIPPIIAPTPAPLRFSRQLDQLQSKPNEHQDQRHGYQYLFIVTLIAPTSHLGLVPFSKIFPVEGWMENLARQKTCLHRPSQHQRAPHSSPHSSNPTVANHRRPRPYLSGLIRRSNFKGSQCPT